MEYVLNLPLWLYSESKYELIQCCNLSPEINSNKTKIETTKIYPKRQLTRLMCAVYLGYLGGTSYTLVPRMNLAVVVLTAMSMAFTYYMVLNRVKNSKGQEQVWAWTHTLNSLVFFANCWAATLYWNSHNRFIDPIFARAMFRVCNAPAFAISVNFLITDWLLLP